MLAPRLTAVVVLPTPPFWLAIARTVPIGSSSYEAARSEGHSLDRFGPERRNPPGVYDSGVRRWGSLRNGTIRPGTCRTPSRADASPPSRAAAETARASAPPCDTRADGGSAPPRTARPAARPRKPAPPRPQPPYPAPPPPDPGRPSMRRARRTAVAAGPRTPPTPPKAPRRA